MENKGTSNPHLWKLALLAGLIWVIILVRYNESGSTATSSEAAESLPEPVSESLAASSTVRPINTQVSTRKATAAAVRLPTSTVTATPTLPPVIHIVQAGEAPLLIAEAYGITVDELMIVNHIDDPGSLQIGQQLLIPITVTPTPQPSPTSLTPQPSPTPAKEPAYHIVQEGDILLAIAAEYETTVEAIMLANDITNPRSLQIGQELLIPPDKGSPLGVKTITYEIQGGDTLLDLAIEYGSTLDDIFVTNPDLEPTLLQIGQQIVIPLTQPRANSGANSASSPGIPRVTTPVEPPPQLQSLEQQMTAAVNAERQAHGLAPYATNEQLTGLARTHAQDMTTRGYFSHVTLEGLTIRDRFAEHGLDAYWVGENIQRNVQPIDQSAQYAFNWFMNSRVHRNNILHHNYDRIGVGVAEGPPGWYTFVLVFAGDS